MPDNAALQQLDTYSLITIVNVCTEHERKKKYKVYDISFSVVKFIIAYFGVALSPCPIFILKSAGQNFGQLTLI